MTSNGNEPLLTWETVTDPPNTIPTLRYRAHIDRRLFSILANANDTWQLHLTASVAVSDPDAFEKQDEAYVRAADYTTLDEAKEAAEEWERAAQTR